MKRQRPHPPTARRVAGWLLGLMLMLVASAAAWAQEDPPGRVARLNEQQGTVSFSPAGDDSWYDAVPNRPITTGDRLWTDRNARAELQVDANALRLDDQTQLVVSELDDDNARFTLSQGRVQMRVRELPEGQRLEIGTANLAVVVEAPGDLRIEADPAAGTTRVAVASGSVTLYGENGESVALGAHQQLTVSGRQLAAVSGAPVRAGEAAFDRWVAERDRVADQSVSARYVPRSLPGYQQLDRYGDWQNDPNYGAVWYPRSVDPDWAPYRDGQWAEIAPWGWTWIDAAPWGFATSHYGRWARIGPRWCWVPGRQAARPVYAPALVGFVGGGHANVVPGGRPGVGWFPLAPGEPWRPGFRASQRYLDEVNRAIAYQRQLARADYLHRNTPGALSLVPVDIFGRGPIARRDFLRVPEDRVAQMQIAPGVPVPLRGDRHGHGFGRSAGALPPADLRPRQIQELQARQLQQAQQVQQQQQQQQQQLLQFQQRAVQAQQEQFQAQQGDRLRQAQQRDGLRQQQEMQQRAAQAQAAQQMQLQQQQALRAQQDLQQRAAQAQAQQQLQLQQQQQALRAQQEMQQRAAQAAQAQQFQAQQLQLQQAQQLQLQQAQRAQQMQAQQQAQQLQMQQHNNALRQSQEIQQRTMQQIQQRAAEARAQQMQRMGRDPQQGDRP